MTNQDVIRLVRAKIADDIIVAKIKQSKTKFNTSVQGLVALKEAGVSDGLISVIVNATNGSSQPAPAGASALPAAPKPGSLPAANASKEVVATDASTASKSSPEPKPVVITQAPANYGMYVVLDGQLKPLGRIETKVQVSKFRSLLKSVVPFVR